MILSKSIGHTEICHILAIFKIKFQIFGKKFPKCAGVGIKKFKIIHVFNIQEEKQIWIHCY
jgi:hypothetical protein